MSALDWQPRLLGKCAKFLSGGTPTKSRSEFWEGDIPWVSSGEMAQTRIYKTLVNAWMLYDNSGSKLKILDWGEKQ